MTGTQERTGAEFRRVAAVREIEQLGATVDVAALDVADEERVAAYLDRFGRTAPPLRSADYRTPVYPHGSLFDFWNARRRRERLHSPCGPDGGS